MWTKKHTLEPKINKTPHNISNAVFFFSQFFYMDFVTRNLVINSINFQIPNLPENSNPAMGKKFLTLWSASLTIVKCRRAQLFKQDKKNSP